MLPLVADMLTYMKGLKPQSKIGAAFGSYGWSGKAAKQISEFLQSAKVEIVAEPLRIKHVPTKEGLAACIEYGRAMAGQIKTRLPAA